MEKEKQILKFLEKNPGSSLKEIYDNIKFKKSMTSLRRELFLSNKILDLKYSKMRYFKK
ncbi:MAG: hypothetical protein ACOCV1_00195 [Bacillota bacterium]